MKDPFPPCPRNGHRKPQRGTLFSAITYQIPERQSEKEAFFHSSQERTDREKENWIIPWASSSSSSSGDRARMGARTRGGGIKVDPLLFARSSLFAAVDVSQLLSQFWSSTRRRGVA